MILQILILLILVSLPGLIMAQPGLGESEELESVEKKNKSAWVVLPIVFYTPETKLAGGFGLINYFNYSEERKNERLSNLSMSFVYTYLHQMNATFIPTFYFNQGKWISISKLVYINFPKDFFGYGNHSTEIHEKFTQKGFQINTSFRMEIFKSFYTGPLFDVSCYIIKNKDPNGALENGNYTGSDKGRMVAPGWVMNYNTRDSDLYSRDGGFYEAYVLFFRKEFGADYEYTNVSLDLRQFFPIFKKQAIGFQFFNCITEGDVPFYSMPTMGGQNMLRGIYQGKYRDHMVMTLQTEYRYMLFDKFFIALFSGVGEVYKGPDDFKIKEFKPAYGAGLRYKLLGNGATLRFDCGRGDGKTQFYITFLEAF